MIGKERCAYSTENRTSIAIFFSLNVNLTLRERNENSEFDSLRRSFGFLGISYAIFKLFISPLTRFRLNKTDI